MHYINYFIWEKIYYIWCQKKNTLEIAVNVLRTNCNIEDKNRREWTTIDTKYDLYCAWIGASGPIDRLAAKQITRLRTNDRYHLRVSIGHNGDIILTMAVRRIVANCALAWSDRSINHREIYEGFVKSLQDFHGCVMQLHICKLLHIFTNIYMDSGYE